MLDHVGPAEIWSGGKAYKKRVYNTRKEVVEDRHIIELFAIGGDSNNLEGLGFHNIDLRKM